MLELWKCWLVADIKKVINNFGDSPRRGPKIYKAEVGRGTWDWEDPASYKRNYSRIK